MLEREVILAAILRYDVVVLLVWDLSVWWPCTFPEQEGTYRMALLMILASP